MEKNLSQAYNFDAEMELRRNFTQPTSPSAELAMDMDANSHKIQLMKASLFVDDDFDAKSGKAYFGNNKNR